jgi:hypothetical protein
MAVSFWLLVEQDAESVQENLVSGLLQACFVGIDKTDRAARRAGAAGAR